MFVAAKDEAGIWESPDPELRAACPRDDYSLNASRKPKEAARKGTKAPQATRRFEAQGKPGRDDFCYAFRGAQVARSEMTGRGKAYTVKDGDVLAFPCFNSPAVASVPGGR